VKDQDVDVFVVRKMRLHCRHYLHVHDRQLNFCYLDMLNANKRNEIGERINE